MTGSVVALEGVGVRVPRRAEPVLLDVTLAVEAGEEVLVVGPSGSGKSTLLHVVSGVVPHGVDAELTGEVRVAGATADTPVVDRARRVGVVGQDPTAGVCMPRVEQEVALALENHGVDPAAMDARIDAALDAVGAGHLRTRATATLSGGQGQRVALAAALVAGPDVLLLDEPTSMLDPAGIASVRRALTAARSARAGGRGPAALVVEHRLDDWAGADGVRGLPARCVALDGGRVLADGPTSRVLREHGPALLAAGCWLPLDAELDALTGGTGGLEDGAHRAFLRSFADDVPDAPGQGPRRSLGAVVLSAHGLAVGRSARGGDGPATLLSGLDLQVRTGEVVALVGPNGVGKTSLLLTLAGLLAPLAGEVRGERAGMVFQDAEHQLLAHTVADEVGHGLPAPDRQARTTAQLERHRLTHLADADPFRLSGGEKRRLSLAAMLAHDRPCLLADEPTLGLDRRDAVTTLRTLRAEADAGRAVVMSSHDLRGVATVADRVVVLADGGVLADGPPASVLADARVTARAGLAVPPLVTWLARHVPPHAVGPALRRLDTAVVTARVPA